MGILDPKTRIFDTIITQEGRRQISSGKLVIEWVSLTDGSTFYEHDVVSGSSDATKRIYFEATNTPQDQITFESDDSGKLLSFKNDKGYIVESGNVYVNVDGKPSLLSSGKKSDFIYFFNSNEGLELYVTNVEEAYQKYVKLSNYTKKNIEIRRTIQEKEEEKLIYSTQYKDYTQNYYFVDENYDARYIHEYSLYLTYDIDNATSSIKVATVKTYENEFEEVTNDLLRSSVDNFKKLQILGTVDTLFNDSEFSINPEKIEFSLLKDAPILDRNTQIGNLQTLESFIEDKRMRHIDNFLYLPPIEKVEESSINVEYESINGILYDNSSIKIIGEYKTLGSKYKKSYKDFEDSLKETEKMGYCKTINFDPTSVKNRLLFQMFEMTSVSISKLDIIEFGTFNTDDYEFPTKKLYFAGKVLLKRDGMQTFVHLFTIVLE